MYSNIGNIDTNVAVACIFVLPMVILGLWQVWTKLVLKSQAEILTKQINEELVKLV